MKVEDFIGEKVIYHVEGQNIYGINNKGELQNIADVRGWGAIQNLFKNKDGSIRNNEAESFKDELGQFIADAINEKLEKLKK
jgi:hypothetical protein